jgi:hypothetical protein
MNCKCGFAIHRQRIAGQLARLNSPDHLDVPARPRHIGLESDQTSRRLNLAVIYNKRVERQEVRLWAITVVRGDDGALTPSVVEWLDMSRLKAVIIQLRS